MKRPWRLSCRRAPAERRGAGAGAVLRRLRTSEVSGTSGTSPGASFSAGAVATPPLLFFGLLSSRFSNADDHAPGSVENGFGPARKSTRRPAADGRAGAGADRAASQRPPAAAHAGNSADTTTGSDIASEGTLNWLYRGVCGALSPLAAHCTRWAGRQHHAVPCVQNFSAFELHLTHHRTSSAHVRLQRRNRPAGAYPPFTGVPSCCAAPAGRSRRLSPPSPRCSDAGCQSCVDAAQVVRPGRRRHLHLRHGSRHRGARVLRQRRAQRGGRCRGVSRRNHTRHAPRLAVGCCLRRAVTCERAGARRRRCGMLRGWLGRVLRVVPRVLRAVSVRAVASRFARRSALRLGAVPAHALAALAQRL